MKRNYKIIAIIISSIFLLLPLKVKAMIIVIRDLTNSTTTFEVEPTDTILSLKQLIQSTFSIESNEILLLNNGFALDDDNATINSLGFQNNTILDLLFVVTIRNNNLNVIMPDRTKFSIVFNEMDSVLSLKQKIKNEKGINISNQILKYSGRILEDNNFLSLYGIVIGSNIDLIILYDITIDSVEHCTINTNKSIANKDDEISLSITPEIGYRLKKIYVINIIDNTNITNNVFNTETSKITMPANPIKIKVDVEEIEYSFDDNSKNVTYTIGDDTQLPLRIKDTDIDNFDKVFINDILLDQEFFDVTTGSLVITLKKEYLNTLENGTYNIRITTKDGGKAFTTFAIARKELEKEEDNPNTNDNIMSSIILGSFSIVGLLECILFLNIKNKVKKYYN